MKCLGLITEPGFNFCVFDIFLLELFEHVAGFIINRNFVDFLLTNLINYV